MEPLPDTEPGAERSAKRPEPRAASEAEQTSRDAPAAVLSDVEKVRLAQEASRIEDA